jgi:catechol 2,3-dioxygenase-like lactoylglutathione lyase family enzyme
MEHVGIVVDDLAVAMAFFVGLGLDLEGEANGRGPLGGSRRVGLEKDRSDVAMMWTPDGHGRLKLIKYYTPPSRGGDPRAPANALGIRHVTFAVEDIHDVLYRLRAHGAELVGKLVRSENSYRLCAPVALRGSSSW